MMNLVEFLKILLLVKFDGNLLIFREAVDGEDDCVDIYTGKVGEKTPFLVNSKYQIVDTGIRTNVLYILVA